MSFISKGRRLIWFLKLICCFNLLLSFYLDPIFGSDPHLVCFLCLFITLRNIQRFYFIEIVRILPQIGFCFLLAKYFPWFSIIVLIMIFLPSFISVFTQSDSPFHFWQRDILLGILVFFNRNFLLMDHHCFHAIWQYY